MTIEFGGSIALTTNVSPTHFNTGNGSKQTLDMSQKWSSAILQELMDKAGDSSWSQWKQSRAAAGLPILEVPVPDKKPPQTEELVFRFDHTKTGAAAVLP